MLTKDCLLTGQSITFCLPLLPIYCTIYTIDVLPFEAWNYNLLVTSQHFQPLTHVTYQKSAEHCLESHFNCHFHPILVRGARQMSWKVGIQSGSLSGTQIYNLPQRRRAGDLATVRFPRKQQMIPRSRWKPFWHRLWWPSRHGKQKGECEMAKG